MYDFTPAERRGAIKILQEIEDEWSGPEVQQGAFLWGKQIAEYAKKLRESFQEEPTCECSCHTIEEAVACLSCVENHKS